MNLAKTFISMAKTGRSRQSVSYRLYSKTEKKFYPMGHPAYRAIRAMSVCEETLQTFFHARRTKHLSNITPRLHLSTILQTDHLHYTHPTHPKHRGEKQSNRRYSLMTKKVPNRSPTTMSKSLLQTHKLRRNRRLQSSRCRLLCWNPKSNLSQNP
eukprot:11687_4